MDSQPRRNMEPTTITLKRLPFGCGYTQLRKFFSQFGTIAHVTSYPSNTKSKACGKGRVVFRDPESAKLAQKTMNGHILFESRIVVVLATGAQTKNIPKLKKRCKITEEMTTFARLSQKKYRVQFLLRKLKKLKEIGASYAVENLQRAIEKAKLEMDSTLINDEPPENKAENAGEIEKAEPTKMDSAACSDGKPVKKLDAREKISDDKEAQSQQKQLGTKTSEKKMPRSAKAKPSSKVKISESLQSTLTADEDLHKVYPKTPVPSRTTDLSQVTDSPMLSEDFGASPPLMSAADSKIRSLSKSTPGTGSMTRKRKSILTQHQSKPDIDADKSLSCKAIQSEISYSDIEVKPKLDSDAENAEVKSEVVEAAGERKGGKTGQLTKTPQRKTGQLTKTPQRKTKPVKPASNTQDPAEEKTPKKSVEAHTDPSELVETTEPPKKITRKSLALKATSASGKKQSVKSVQKLISGSADDQASHEVQHKSPTEVTEQLIKTPVRKVGRPKSVSHTAVEKVGTLEKSVEAESSESMETKKLPKRLTRASLASKTSTPSSTAKMIGRTSERQVSETVSDDTSDTLDKSAETPTEMSETTQTPKRLTRGSRVKTPATAKKRDTTEETNEALEKSVDISSRTSELIKATNLTRVSLANTQSTAKNKGRESIQSLTSNKISPKNLRSRASVKTPISNKFSPKNLRSTIKKQPQ